MAQRNRNPGYRDDIEQLRKGAKGVTDTTVLFPLDEELNALYIALLRTPRGYMSVGEKLGYNLIVTYLENQLSGPDAFVDGYGNIHVYLGESETMFSCHIDTVHRDNKPVTLMTDGDYVFTDGNSQLGADDGTGILIMLWMIKCGIPGKYIFHRNEEVGGLGSNWFAMRNEPFLSGLKRAIAFDRAGTSDIVVSQASGTCASKEFSTALGAALGAVDDTLKLSSADGIFTDTDNYAYLIPECTNLSVGYYNEHTYHEKQDLIFLERLCNAVIQINWELLPAIRDPEQEDDLESWYNWKYGGSVGTSSDMDVPTDDMQEQEIRDIMDVIAKYSREYAIHLTSMGISSFDVEAICQSINARSGYK